MTTRHVSLLLSIALFLAARAPAAEVTTFPLNKVKQLRDQAVDARQVSDEDTPNGWSKSPVDFAKFLKVFAPLRLKKGIVLRAYQFKDSLGGNGFVWAMPADAAFPAPAECPQVELERTSRKVPKPPAALDNVMDVIEGDGSPESYVAASLLERELTEFGAIWHGCNWTNHKILGEDPLKARGIGDARPVMEVPTGKPEEWKWLEEAPKQWNPQVRFEKESVVVTFYTYSGYQTQAIYRHTDTYKQGTYRFKTERKEIASGPKGFFF